MKRLIDNIMSWNRLRTETIKVPMIQLDPSHINVIKTPMEFYQALKILALKSKHRISISSLYIGTGPLETELIECFEKAKQQNSNLDVNILLDYNRATREIRTNQNAIQSSKSLLMPFVDESRAGFKVNFFLTHTLSGWHRKFWRRPKWNELQSLHHMKLYIFDDDIIISGANLSDLYFTNRQDRYVHIKKSPILCDYFDQLIRTISKFSFQLKSNGNLELSDECRWNPKIFSQRSEYVKNTRKAILSLNQRFKLSSMDDRLDESLTIALPLLQMKTFNIIDEEEFTSYLFDMIESDQQLNLATGYFNLVEKYQAKLLRNRSERALTILMASEQANGFYNGKGILKFIPLVYTYYVRKFVEKMRPNSNIIVRYYNKANWSFHAKGLWLDDVRNKQFITMIGSTNLGYRSVFRDNESQIVIVTKDQELRRKFIDEYAYLTKQSFVVSKNVPNELPEIPRWVALIARLFKSFF
ncbi:CDP-diacylglycerol--glycerol-3-phosphate 3-phosphatidyltransferase [Sarcoptes scabiei]|nr:CDP-diacylglycerol--glycerol-3-phosphate 3-phosphatidyltransferase [Sarcoptes scabiei]